MYRQIRHPAAVALLYVLYAGAALPADRAPQPASSIVLTGARLIDGTGAKPIENAWIRIDGPRIAQVGQGAPPAMPGAQVVDVRGKTVIPGLSDMHVHLGELQQARWMLKLLLAHGVTTVRDTANSLGNLAAIRGWLAAEPVAPHLYVSGVILPTGEMEANLEFLKPGRQTAEVLEDNAAFGVDFIKIHNFISSEALKQIIAFCHAHDLPLIGHTPLGMTSVAAIEAGQTGLEHLRLRASEILDDPQIVARYPIDIIVNYRELMWAHFDPNGRNVQVTLDAWSRHKDKIFIDPTLISRYVRFHNDTPEFNQAPELRYVSPAVLQRWRKQGEGGGGLLGSLSAEQFALGKKQSVGEQAFVRLLSQRGFRLLTGTDMPIPYVIPGVSLLRELTLLVEAGLSPVDVIHASTGTAAEALRNKSRGTITPGQDADLVIVAGNVAADIKAITNIERVMLGGKLYDRAGLLDGATRLAAADQPSPRSH
ncbi:MAG: amidohydrolase family protein [Acidobacteria bacterium]|nr:amidohydrolase family protein [Acidobacteriota bacterium]